jgi:hypothetical protein
MNLLEEDLEINAGGVTLAADLVIPEAARGVVRFAHGSGTATAAAATARATDTWPANCSYPGSDPAEVAGRTR